MRRSIVSSIAIGMLILFGHIDGAIADVDVHVNVGVPPPPVVVYETQPEVVLVPRTQVYYVPGAADYDFYRYGGYWYINRGGYWYRGRSYRGPFAAIAFARVPHEIVVVPGAYHHHPFHPPHPHGGPPGQMKKHGHGHGH
jgi:hypothetical protein